MTSGPSSLARRYAAVGSIVAVAALSIGAAAYLSVDNATSSASGPRRTVVHTVWPSASERAKQTYSKTPWPKPIKSTTIDTVTPKAYPVSRHLPNESGTADNTIVDSLLHCWDFKWQQDAQAAYLANLSDPGGLDGMAGPNNGDGLACNELPVDPSRPKSTPVDGIVSAPTSVPHAAEVRSTTKTYFGASSDVLPGDVKAYTDLDSDVGKAPGLLEFFDTWDHPYAATGVKVQQAWQHGAVPVLTWMPEPKGGTNQDVSAYTMDHILAGDWDAYLYRYAASVSQTGLPMVLRFAHEMNGAWYPWSAGITQITGAGIVTTVNNTPAKYVAMWRHVWQVFNNVGANRFTIWAWTPVTVQCTTHYKTAKTGVLCKHHFTTYGEDYPGDDVVDWVGMSSYAYGSAAKYTFASNFGTSFKNMAAVTKTKPVFVAETGAAQRITTPGLAPQTFATAVSMTTQKEQWVQQTLAGFLHQGTGAPDDYLNPGQHVVGFVLFNNYVGNVHVFTDQDAKKIKTETDWRWNSSPGAAQAFRVAIADPRYAGGIMPTVRSTVFPDPDLVPWPVVPLPPGTTSAPTTSTSPAPGDPDPSDPAPSSTPTPTPTATPTSASPTPSATPTSGATPSSTSSGSTSNSSAANSGADVSAADGTDLVPAVG